MVKRMILVLLFVVGIPVLSGQIRASNIEDGEILTACQQACPSQAITFGNIKDRNSQVSKLKTSALNYGMLTDLNTKPRTTYLGRIRNPNPVLEANSSKQSKV